jgi:hypothetical protein
VTGDAPVASPQAGHITRIEPSDFEEAPVYPELTSEATLAARRALGNWRYVIGTFQVKIPVTTAEVMLSAEENTLAIMKWRLQQLPFSSRWYPVLQRYISYLAGRVDGLGGDSGSIEPSPNGISPTRPKPCAEREYTGKICNVVFDCFGELEGFELRDCCETHGFTTRERGIGELALRACRERLTVSVYATVDRRRRICRLVIRC